MRNKIPLYLLETQTGPKTDHGEERRVRPDFLERGLLSISAVVKETYVQWDLSVRNGLFQRLDPRLKLLFLAFFVAVINLKRGLLPEIYIAGILFIFILLSNLKVKPFYTRILALTFLFGIFLSFPSAFNVLVPGTVVFPMLILDRSYDFLFYHIPQTIGLTREGLYHVGLLSLRVANSLTVCLLTLYTTPFPDLAKALRLLRVPDVIVMTVTLFYKYLFILSCSLGEMHLAMKSRLASSVSRKEARLWAADRMACLYHKSRRGCEEVFRAMISRGFAGDIELPHPRQLSGADWIASSILGVIWIAIVLL